MMKEDLHLIPVPYLSHYFFIFLTETVHPKSMKQLAAEETRFAEEGGARLLNLLHKQYECVCFFGAFYFGTLTRSGEA